MNANDNTGDELLDNLTKFSPESLTYITLSDKWKYSIDSFERFFEGYNRERTLIVFNIFNISGGQFNITENHKVVIRKFMREGVLEFSNIT